MLSLFQVIRAIVLGTLVGFAAGQLVLASRALGAEPMVQCADVYAATVTAWQAEGYVNVENEKLPNGMWVSIFARGVHEAKAIAFVPGIVTPKVGSLYQMGGQCVDGEGVKTYGRAYYKESI